MKLYSILPALAVCLGLASQGAHAVTCQPNLLPSNPDTAYTLPVIDNGTVTHAPTGLTWKRCSEGQSWSGGTCTGTAVAYTWPQALKLATGSTFANFTDWRVPNVKELRSLVEECRQYPAINDTIFPVHPNNEFWSSSPQDEVAGTSTWLVGFAMGGDFPVWRLGPSFFVHLVRGGDYFDKLTPSTTSLLSVSATGAGTGTISSDASDVNGLGQVSCTSTASSLSGTCLTILNTGSSVTLTAAPASGGTFNGWSGVCSGTFPTCTVSMTAAKVVTATFSGGTAVPTVPGALTGLLATPGDASAIISFTPPTSGGAATSYFASCTATGATTLTGTAFGSPIPITGMTNGTTYSCTVLARNSVGNGRSATVPVTPVASTAVPGALSSLIATPGDTSASIAFTAPSSGGAVTSYKASCTATGATTRTGTASGSPIPITGMTNGTTYSCAVLATNSHGPGPASSISVTPAAPLPSTGCYPLSNIHESSSADAHVGSVVVTSGGVDAHGVTCPGWGVTSNNPDWITVGSTPAVSGSTTRFIINYSVAAYTGTTSRTGTLSMGAAPNTRTYAVTQYGPNGMPAPTCTLTASPASITTGGSSTLTASCDLAATSYVWTGADCAGTSAASCTVTPAATASYSVAGINSKGTGTAANATVTVNPPAPVCTLTALPASISAGDSSTLTASCDQTITSYVWTGDSCAGTTAASCTVTPATTTSYSVAGTSVSNGTSAAASATVTALINQGAVAGTLITRYRLYSDVTKEHLYTTDPNEYNVLGSQGWVAEGAIYKLFQGAGSLAGVAAVPYYRLYNPSIHQHHWTPDLNEYTVLAGLGWLQEGIDGYILPTAVGGTLPLYRLSLNASGGLHLWTTDANERNQLTTTAGWVNEGVAGYVIPLP